MNRRIFSKHLSLSLGAVALPSMLLNASPQRTAKLLKPKRLKKEDTIGLISPGSYISDESLEKAVKNIEGLGFKVKLSKNIRAKKGFIAGTDVQRLADIHAMFSDKSVVGIWCARGGYGCGRLLPHLNYKLIKQNPKILIGYSDITALLNAIYCKTGLIGFHGPVGASDFSDYSLQHLENLLINPTENYVIKPLHEESSPFQIINRGKATGKLIGGNLSLLASMAGTPYLPDFKNKIILLEDIGEKPYRLDRMLVQLHQSTNLAQAAGIALGVFADCEAKEGSDSLSLSETLEGQLKHLNIPTVYGLTFGHIGNMATFPIGAEVELEAQKGTIKILDSIVQ